MNQPIIFTFKNQHVRIVLIDGDPHWVAKDVVESLDLTWSGISRIQHVPEQWRVVTSVVTTHGTREMHTLSEKGLYFFLQRCDSPKARPFQEWLAGDVIPSIRRTGSYSMDPAPPPMLSADQIIAIGMRLKELESEVAELQPKAVAYSQIAESSRAVSMKEAAAALRTGQNRLFRFCRDRKIFPPNSRTPYQKYIEMGWFDVRIKAVWKGEKIGWENEAVTLVTGKGIEGLGRMLGVIPHFPEDPNGQGADPPKPGA